MGRTLRLSEGRFGRLVLAELAAADRLEAQDDPVIVLQSRYDDVLFLNPAETHNSSGPTRVLVLHAAREWLRTSFPAVFEPAEGRPFVTAAETISPRIRQLADARNIPGKLQNTVIVDVVQHGGARRVLKRS